MKIQDELAIDAPVEVVWRAIEDVAAHTAWHPFVTAIAGEHRLGAARTCSVLVGGKPGETTERCVEHEPGVRIVWAIERDTTGFSRMVSDWRAGFSVAPRGAGTVVVATSSFTPRWMARVLAPIIRSKFHQTQAKILAGLNDAVTCSRSSRRSGATPARAGGTS